MAENECEHVGLFVHVDVENDLMDNDVVLAPRRKRLRERSDAATGQKQFGYLCHAESAAMIFENRVDLGKLFLRYPNRIAADRRFASIALEREERYADQSGPRQKARDLYLFAQDRMVFDPRRFVEQQGNAQT